MDEISTGPLISVSDLRVRFDMGETTIHAVNGVNFELNNGEVLGIIGESGCGKSVTLRALMGLLPPSYTRIDGQIMVAGLDILKLDDAALRDIRGTIMSIVFQEPMTALDPVFTIGAQIAETIVRHDGVSYGDANRRALDLLEVVQIPSAARRLKSYPHEMSGGMQQRAMIALALSCRPKVLLADEPTTALDVTVQIQIILLLRKLQRELDMAVIFVTHDVGVAVEISDRVAVMYAGQFVETGTVENVINSPAHPYTDGLLASTVVAGTQGLRLDTIPGAPPHLHAPPESCGFEQRCRFADDRCRAEPPAAFSFDGTHITRCLRVAKNEIELPKSRFSK